MPTEKMTKEEIIIANKEYLFPAVFHFYQEPLVIARGKDQYVWDADGNQYLDFLGGIVTVSVGHCNDQIDAKVHRQIDTLQHVSTLFANEPQAALAKKIASITPGGMLSKSFFTFSLGIDPPEITKQKTLEAADYPVLKVKVGLATDEPTIEAVRSVTKKPLRVDANEGWKDKEEAVRKINWLEKMGVEFIEQPMPAEMLEETRWVRARVHIPIIADEACQRAADIPKLRECFDGVNVKLDKSGGMLEAWRMLEIARALGMKTMLGCMISSSVTVTAAAHLSPLVDFSDLDGNLLISNDPFHGVRVEKGKLILPKGPGLGLTPV